MDTAHGLNADVDVFLVVTNSQILTTYILPSPPTVDERERPRRRQDENQAENAHHINTTTN